MMNRERLIGRKAPRSIYALNRWTDLLAADLAALEDKVRSLENLRAHDRAVSSRSRHEVIVTIDDSEIIASNLDDRFSEERQRALKILQRRRLEGII